MGLPDGCSDASCLQALEQALDALTRRFDPGRVIYLAVADPFEGVCLGRLRLNHDGREARDRCVFDWACQRRIPLALAMAGGYGVNIDDTDDLAGSAGSSPRRLRPVCSRRAPDCGAVAWVAVPARWRLAKCVLMSLPTRPQADARSAYRVFRPIGTRWSDNDMYGHVNNVVYYSWFDTAVNGHLIETGAIDIHQGEVIGLVVETQCNYFSPLAFPDPVLAGIRVAHIGSSSVRYEVGLFSGKPGDPAAEMSAARGHFIHVYVDKQTRRPVALPPQLLSALEKLK